MWEPYILERAFICRNLGWKLLPEDLDDMSLELKHAVESIFVFESFRQYAIDLEQLSEPQSKMIAAVEDVRDVLRKKNDD